jgi:proteic killer suppression protein
MLNPANKFHSLSGDGKGQYAIRMNEQWRVCFEWYDGNAYRVEITEYH